MLFCAFVGQNIVSKQPNLHNYFIKVTTKDKIVLMFSVHVFIAVVRSRRRVWP